MCATSAYIQAQGASGNLLLSDDFSWDSSLNRDLWAVNTPLVGWLANTSIPSIPMRLVALRLDFSGGGMTVSGVSAIRQFAGIQSRQEFTPPFTVEATVMGVAAFANPFALYLVSPDTGQFLNLFGNLNPDNGQPYKIGVNLRGQQAPQVLDAHPKVNQWYTLTIAVNASGNAAASVVDEAGHTIGRVTGLDFGVSRTYVVLSQNEPSPRTVGPNEAIWRKLTVVRGTPDLSPTSESRSATRDGTFNLPGPAAASNDIASKSTGSCGSARLPPPSARFVNRLGPPAAEGVSRAVFSADRWVEAGEFTEALQLYREAAADTSDRDAAHAGRRIGAFYELGYALKQDYEQAMLWYRKAADGGDVTAILNIGRLYDNAFGVPRDYATALVWYRRAAERVNAEAMTNIGAMYSTGQGVERDYDEAMRWLRRSASQGEPTAMRYIGSMYDAGHGVPQDDAEAMRWFRKAADQGNARAMNGIGYLFDSGRGVRQDFQEAMRWYRKAAEGGGDPMAMNNIGALYESGSGVSKDYGEAKCWYLVAADLGDPIAMTNIGSLYGAGHGVLRDYAQALRWYRKAADLDNALAMRNIGVLYDRGYGVRQDYSEARRWYSKAADRGDAVAMNNMGVLYYEGEGVAQDYPEAMRWYLKAADQNDPVALTNIGTMYEKGAGAQKNYAQAMRLFRKAADQGEPNAMNGIGVLYHNGEGVPRDDVSALLWYRRAAALGNDFAKLNLARMAAGLLEGLLELVSEK